MLDFSEIKTYPISQRRNLVHHRDFVRPKGTRITWDNKDLRRLAGIIRDAARDDRVIILQMGAHVVKCGMSLIICDLMKRGYATHLAMNGAVAIHDFEMALIGQTSEDVAEGIEDGSFGMADETGRFMNEAVNASQEGFGRALGRTISEKNLPFKDYSILSAAFEMEVPATVHVAIGTDVIHQHPTFDGARTGAATHHDFKVYTETVSRLSHGVVLNLGSAVIMPEVFLKALSISRNLGFKVAPLYAASFDVRKDVEDHFFRPNKNVVCRPTSLGGEGFNFSVEHEKSIPSLHRLLLAEEA